MTPRSLLVHNGTVVTLGADQAFIEKGAVYCEGSNITAVGRAAELPSRADAVLDAGGGVILPGLINAHHHLYSTLARGWTPPGEPGRNFKEILERVWWRLDRALTPEDVYYSSIIPLMEAAKAGCTTIIDHHASPGCTDGSLDIVERAFRETGLSGCLCYEVSDRNRIGDGIAENERFIRKCRAHPDGQMAALLGLHASMTLTPQTMERCAALVDELDVGVHVHVAEAECDGDVTRAEFHEGLMERFDRYGMTGPGSLFAHGIHLGAEELAILHQTNSMLVTNPESNMNNGLAVTPVLDALQRGILLGLGTDGMANAMIAQTRAAYLVQRDTHRDPRVAFVEACDMLLKNNRAICDRLFREHRGELTSGKLADIAVFDYTPFTPFESGTFFGHLLFGLVHAPVRHTVARGRVVVRDGALPHLDEAALRAKAVEHARKLWARIG
ncbi:MAG TPA: putative aminohydrolase SsnA [Kiritimatiellia bacterium]|nr:putative aminohydrolase SsnA [Kiritimatiellia bacterium]